MKVQELLPGSKPSPASRAARALAPDAKPFDFANALSEARSRKPDPKRVETDAPDEKKPPATKRKTAKDEPTRADDGAAPEASIAADEAEARGPVTEDEPVAEGDESLELDEAEDGTDPEQAEGELDLSAIALAQQGTPQAVHGLDDSGDWGNGEPAEPARVVIDGSETTESTTDAEGNAGIDGAETGGIPLDLDALAGLEGDEGISSGPEDAVADSDGAPAAKGLTKQPAAPVVAADGGNTAQHESTAKDGDDQQQRAPFASDVTAAADVSEEAAGSVPAAQGSSDVTTSSSASTTAHYQAEPTKAQATQVAPAAPAPLPQAHFTEANHPKIVTAIQTQALTNGGTMQIRLDPPELGALQVLVHMQDGVMTASFQTSNDDATRLLSHSLSQLKQVLESQGVSVEKLQVQQAPKDQQAGNSGDDGQHPRDQHSDAHRQEQQRKDMLRRMWRRLANGSDPLDLVA